MTLTFDPAPPRIDSRVSAVASRESQWRALQLEPIADAFVVLSTPLAQEAFEQTERISEPGSEQTGADTLKRLHATLERLSALWWAFEPLLGEEEARVTRKRFRRLAKLAGEPHELDAACALLVQARKHRVRVGPLVRTLEKERRESSATNRDTIRRAKLDHHLRRALAGARRSLEVGAQDPVLGEFARERISLAQAALIKKEQRAAKMKHVDGKTLQGIDEAACKLQCLLELFAPVLSNGYRLTVMRNGEAPSALGRLGDVLASETVLRRIAPTLADKTVIDDAARWLHKERRGEARAAIKRFRSLHKHG